jgi:transcriptional regulator with XRE-family HTH domain
MSAQAMPDLPATSEANPLPTSAEIIGFLVKTLEVELDLDIKERTWRNYIAGRPVSDKTREAIFDALARAIRGSAGDSSHPQGQLVSEEEVLRGLREVLLAQARYWDDIRTQLPAGASPRAVPLLAIVALRLAIIDLALRFAVLLVRDKDLQPPPEEPPAPGAPDSTPTLEENVLGRLLRELLKMAKLTRDELAEALDVSKQAVDKWLDGRDLPPAGRLEEIVDLVVQRTGTTKDSTPARVLLRGLRLLSKVTRSLEACIGGKQLEQLGLAFFRLTKLMWRRLAHMHFHPEEFRGSVHGELLLVGSHSYWGQQILREIAPQEQDIVWSGLVRAAGMDWARTLAGIQQVAHGLADLERIADTEGFRHFDLEEQAEVSLLLAFVPQEQLPDFLARLNEASPELRSQAGAYFLSLRLEGVRELPDGQEKLLELARLAEACRLAASTSQWESEAFNRLAWVCHAERLHHLLRPLQGLKSSEKATLERVIREVVAALDETPRRPPPADMRDWQEYMVKVLLELDLLCYRVDTAVRGELEHAVIKLVPLPMA